MPSIVVEPQEPGAIVVVHHGDPERQEVWVKSSVITGYWESLGVEFGLLRFDVHAIRVSGIGLVWADVLARGPVTLMVPAGDIGYRGGWQAGRWDLWDSITTFVKEEAMTAQ